MQLRPHSELSDALLPVHVPGLELSLTDLLFRFVTHPSPSWYRESEFRIWAYFYRDFTSSRRSCNNVSYKRLLDRHIFLLAPRSCIPREGKTSRLDQIRTSKDGEFATRLLGIEIVIDNLTRAQRDLHMASIPASIASMSLSGGLSYLSVAFPTPRLGSFARRTKLILERGTRAKHVLA